MKKKITFIFVLVFIVMCFAQIASANTSIKNFGKEVELVFEGKSYYFDSGNLRELNGTLMVPLREFSSNIGVTVKKISANTVSATKYDTSIEFTIDSKIAKLNQKKVTLPLAPTVVDGVTYVPLKFLASAFEHNVIYNQYIGKCNR